MALPANMAVFRHRAYLLFFVMRQTIAAARQMEAVAIGFVVYDIARGDLGLSVERSAFLLGLVGLTQFLPVLLLSLIGGQAADRLDRKMILVVSNTVRLIGTLVLLRAVFLPGETALPVIFVVAGIFGCVNAFTPAAANSLFPRLVPRNELTQAIAWNSLGFQTAVIVGPAIGGLLYVIAPQVVFATAAVMIVGAILAISLAETPKHRKLKDVRGARMMLDGLKYIGRNRIVMGAISLDLVVVFFGGAIALLPVFVRDVLHVQDWWLGVLRASPAIGAATVAMILATKPLARRVGRWMFGAVIIYGMAILVFGLSPWVWLSMAALVVTGAADEISVYVRASLIQLATPDEMKGRVSSVSFIFISASNELGEFESGVAARFLGPVGAVIFGGAMAITTALIWMRLFPQLSGADRFDDVEEQAEEGKPVVEAKEV